MLRVPMQHLGFITARPKVSCLSLPLPERCSARVDGVHCQLPPSYVVSVVSGESSYMLAVVCEDHKEKVKKRLIQMQNNNVVPDGSIEFEPIKAVVTDCIIGTKEDYVEVELNRGNFMQ